MKCIICKVKEIDGWITHKFFCADYAQPDHKTRVEKK